MYFTYVLKSTTSDRYYIGSAEDVNMRLLRHNRGEVLSTKRYRPWVIVYTASFETRADAVRRERQLKSWKSSKYLVQQLGLNV